MTKHQENGFVHGGDRNQAKGGITNFLSSCCTAGLFGYSKSSCTDVDVTNIIKKPNK